MQKYKIQDNMLPKISVIVPCYNSEKYLDRCINSLVNQSLQEMEIILVDDGSPDRVPEICDSWAMKDKRIKVIHKNNEGPGYARNSGIEIATSEYVAFVDSDDYISVDTYHTAYKEARKEDACAVFFGIKKEYQKGKWSNLNMRQKQIWQGNQIANHILDRIACAPYEKEERKWYSSACCGIYKHSIIRKNSLRFLPGYLSEDLLFNIAFLEYANKIVYLPKILYYYCLNSGSVSTTFRIDMYDRLLFLHELLIQKTSKIKGGTERADRYFIGFVRVYISALVTSHRKNKKDILNHVLNDKIWDELKLRYKPGWLPPYQNVFYRLILGKFTGLLMCYTYFASIIRHYFVKKR